MIRSKSLDPDSESLTTDLKLVLLAKKLCCCSTDLEPSLCSCALYSTASFGPKQMCIQLLQQAFSHNSGSHTLHSAHLIFCKFSQRCVRFSVTKTDLPSISIPFKEVC